MKIAVLGTGIVGQAHAAKLSELGHDVMVGTHDVPKTLSRTQPDPSGNPPFSAWIKNHQRVVLMTLADAAAQAGIVIEALNGQAVLDDLTKLQAQLAGKVLVDVANPLDFSKGRPPTLFVCNDNSLGEQIQAALPNTKVVKAFNTMNASVQTEPQKLAGGIHHLFIAGNDPSAKAQVIEIASSYGWQNILDLGDIKAARGMEMLMPIWLEIMATLKTPNFNFNITQ